MATEYYNAIATDVSPYVTVYAQDGDVSTKIADPATLPTGAGRSTAWSPDSTYLAVAHTTSPYVTVYSRSGDTLTKLTNPATLPTGEAHGVSWSNDGTYLAVAHTTSPYVSIYERVGTTLTKITNPGTLPTGNGKGVAFSADGTHLAVHHTNFPWTTAYSRSGSTFTKLPNPATTAQGNGDGGVAWTADAGHLAVAHRYSPYMTVYSRSGSTLTKLSNPSTLVANEGQGVNWSPDGTYLAVAHQASPYLSVYQLSGSTLTKLTNPASLPSTLQGFAVSWSPDGDYLSFSGYAGPKVTVYSRSGTTFTKLAAPATWPPGTYGSGTAYSGTLNTAPTAPTWDTAAGAHDVAAPLLLDWTFNDPDGDASTAYALQRTVNAGSVEWWNGSSWGGTETKLVTADTSLTIASPWATDGDSTVYKVLGYDAADVVSPLSTGLTIVAAAKVDPTITSPTAGEVINSGSIDADWICTSQSKFTLRLLTAADVELWTSGLVTSTSLRSHAINYPLTNSTTFKVELTTISLLGVTSDTQTTTFSTSFTTPQIPTLTLFADSPVPGAATIVVAQGVSTGTVITHNDLYRREEAVGGNGIRISSTMEVDGTIVSYTQRAETLYEYRAVAVGENLTETSSVWT